MIYTIDNIRSILHPILSSYNVRKAVLFGSYANGKATDKSDIDLLVDSGLHGLAFVGLIEDVRLALNKNVDVFDITHIIPNSKIDNELRTTGITIYESNTLT